MWDSMRSAEGMDWFGKPEGPWRLAHHKHRWPQNMVSTYNCGLNFDFKDKNKTEQFLKQSSENGFLGLNGHRSIGGVRISNYNSISQEMVSNLLEFIQKFLSSY